MSVESPDALVDALPGGATPHPALTPAAAAAAAAAAAVGGVVPVQPRDLADLRPLQQVLPPSGRSGKRAGGGGGVDGERGQDGEVTLHGTELPGRRLKLDERAAQATHCGGQTGSRGGHTGLSDWAQTNQSTD